MAGVFTHFQTLDAITQSLPPGLRATADEHPPFANFGSVGPDYLYFWKNDWGVAGQAGGLFFSLLDDLREVHDVYNSVVTAQENISNWLSGGATGVVKKDVDLIAATITNRIAEMVTKQVDLFETFRPPIADHPEKSEIRNWWWADIAHQHKTVDFSRYIWKHSAGNPELRSYAIGYLSHVATDIVSHPYINLLSGGPYRNHWRRHNLIERVYDTHFWGMRTGEELTESKAHRRIHFPSVVSDRPDIPENLCRFLAGAYEDTYGSMGIVSGIPSSDDIRAMYLVLL